MERASETGEEEEEDPRLQLTRPLLWLVAFFFALGYGARLLGPMFCRPHAWRVVETGSGLVMWTLAINLASTTFGP